MQFRNLSITNNYGYVLALYKRYRDGDKSISSDWKEYFRDLDHKESSVTAVAKNSQQELDNLLLASNADQLLQSTRRALLQSQVSHLVNAFRTWGHLAVELDPLNLAQTKYPQELNYKQYHISEEDFENGTYPGNIFNTENLFVKDIFKRLIKTYSSRFGLEFQHLENSNEKNWLANRVEKDSGYIKPTKEHQIDIYNSIAQVAMFEKYLHTKFPGAKRFSIEGGESTITAIEQIIKTSAEYGVEESVLGMSHRGRLSVLTKIMGKAYRAVFSEFADGTFFSESLGIQGDVKYHLGASSKLKINNKNFHVSLTHNPSHLEAVSSVVLGRVRAKQECIQDQEHDKVMAILLHGDAAFSGQGSVMETLVLSNMNAYSTGGTIHIITNNQIGFTTNANASRSGTYCTDVAKMIDAPVFHVNGNDPEAVAYVAGIASQYRQKFKKDIFIDIVCYRKFGHNEGDEPMFTQPVVYERVNKMESLSKVYGERLLKENILTFQQVNQSQKKFKSFLDDELLESKTYRSQNPDWLKGIWKGFSDSTDDAEDNIMTSIPVTIINMLVNKLSTIPNNFTAHTKIARIYGQRKKMLQSGLSIDWGMGETLAYAALLHDGYHVRITGQDVERGTFSHRHAVIHDQKTNAKFIPLSGLNESEAGTFRIHNSTLSEFAVLGFEYGYSLSSPKTLVIWEAQFGDFANGAQVIIDQFIASGKTKWMRMSGLVMLLPHGYEGQGPEHSSARVERFLQLCANDNMTVANCTTPASFFHLLRRQMFRTFRTPLIVMTPKSLLRHKLAVSVLEDFTGDLCFQKIIKDDLLVSNVKKVIFCSGKIYYDLLKYRQDFQLDNVALIRLEQLYPFPSTEVLTQLKRYKNANSIIWCQEEHKNMGSWNFVRDFFAKSLSVLDLPQDIKYIGRKESASPAVGHAGLHSREQDELISSAFKL